MRERSRVLHKPPGPNGYKVIIGYRPYDQPSQPMTPTDGLDLAGQSERDLRDFLKAHGIAIPSGQLFVIEIRSKDDARYASRFATTTMYTRPQQIITVAVSL
jgi:hypothetical protein